ncbi:aminotransferase class V-fold PLP-dependent enzyme [Trinickia caryophylli]|uniref:Glutamate or tyrosine decarboxylase n=1 Tax=Trinickia caryophylli TaxID=28094 RepID=A0A1X7GDM3_TRICW|nr:aminotransferase class V-fold PLP-dependent enzyme [Trinickia caryophylli]PMS10782.1 aspartate aminotransferase family protein [Trinickia caryophylli]TRX13842.1 aspartate aminotransferase family protein [Trinickia caryophylli]WQE15433.1 aminotransferase class V-fold PLP-dependent enzyme [Trinickia caryophylli]SMF68264.1 Glutamate or tyrosine decarboxylase [Trinickia caryophylli]GLU33831.1 aspartate aminotransferase family protein [Trinickia caryophylli]
MTDASFRPALEHAFDHALVHLESLGRQPVAATATLDSLRERLAKPLNAQPLPPERVVDELAADTAGGIVGSAGGRFFGWVIGGALPASLAADWLTSAWDQNAASYACAPAEAVVEEVCGVWLKDVLRLPPAASFALTSGCQTAHVTALAAARHALLQRRGWQVERDGLFGAPRIRILTSDQFHGSVLQAARLLGMGTASVIGLPSNEHGQLDAPTLEEALVADADAATIVLLQAGDLNIGAYDPFPELIPLAHRYGAWVHVDGAFGLWANASARHRHLLEGVEQADSWATDGHKWLNVPYDSGFAFVADSEAHRGAMAHQASYVSYNDQVREQKDWTPVWSRRGRGFATYAALRELGREGIASLVERNCAAAHALATRIGALPGAELVWAPQINQGLVRFPDPRAGATQDDHDAWTDAVTQAILATGEALFSNTTWRGMRCMRISVCNWQTDENDVARAVAAVETVLRAKHAGAADRSSVAG